MSQNLEQFVNQKVTLQKKAADGSLEEITGTVLAANEIGVLLKPKGKTQGSLIALADIEGDIVHANEKPKKLTQRTLKVIAYGGARQHLITSHGYALTEIQAMSESRAFDFHAGLDHTDLGHTHSDAKPAESADDAA
jgi:hypothetical protein